mmetsp:Transcript_19568/g.34226  ORF Transcript_19568/g.34226 Transcript_19568/m.34226 type:complete len:88 (-) Transcript_19568:24-287(-)
MEGERMEFEKEKFQLEKQKADSEEKKNQRLAAGTSCACSAQRLMAAGANRLCMLLYDVLHVAVQDASLLFCSTAVVLFCSTFIGSMV